MFDVVSGSSGEWRDVDELLDESGEEIGVFALEEDTEVFNGSRRPVPQYGFAVSDIDAVRGDYMLFPEKIVDGVRDIVDQSFMTVEDINEANFYVGQSKGVPWFELKLEQSYEIPENEAPHIHSQAWELYYFHGGEATLEVGDINFDFAHAEESWYEKGNKKQVEASEGEIVAVPPGVPHQVIDQYGNPDLVVAKYSLRKDGDIGKYGLDGRRVDPWASSDRDRMNAVPASD